jgi:enamine deaminase RidA (YjgF/YER057c/UK114 family)
MLKILGSHRRLRPFGLIKRFIHQEDGTKTTTNEDDDNDDDDDDDEDVIELNLDESSPIELKWSPGSFGARALRPSRARKRGQSVGRSGKLPPSEDEVWFKSGVYAHYDNPTLSTSTTSATSATTTTTTTPTTPTTPTPPTPLQQSKRINIPAIGAWGDLSKCSRAVRVGNTIHVSGTCAPGDSATEQVKAIFDVITPALHDAGARIEDVVLCRMFAADIQNDWEELGAAHGAIFQDTKPACTLVGGDLLMDWMKVEIEVTAVVQEE